MEGDRIDWLWRLADEEMSRDSMHEGVDPVAIHRPPQEPGSPVPLKPASPIRATAFAILTGVGDDGEPGRPSGAQPEGILLLTKTAIDVLAVLLAATDDRPAWGLSICQDAGLGPGTVYPILERLVDLGWVETAPHLNRSARRCYRLTAVGRTQAQAALAAPIPRRAFRPGLAGGDA
jgi:DNA-binding MarR family transcriptional regulator